MPGLGYTRLLVGVGVPVALRLLLAGVFLEGVFLGVFATVVLACFERVLLTIRALPLSFMPDGPITLTICNSIGSFPEIGAPRRLQ
jgi:hypothetical protein